MDTFRFNSEKNWDANHHLWDGLNSSFLSKNARDIIGTGRFHSTSPAQLITNNKDFYIHVKKFAVIKLVLCLMKKNLLLIKHIIMEK